MGDMIGFYREEGEVMNIIYFALGIPKSLWFCFKSLPMKDALKMPVWVSHRTKFKSLKGKVVIQEELLRPAMIRFGYGGSGTASFKPVIIENTGTMVLRRGVFFGGGCQICIGNNDASFRVGRNTHFMGECHIVARDRIEIGVDCAISWDTQIMDTDIHKIYSGHQYINKDVPVMIGNHVWVCSGVKIGKGVQINDNTIIASGALITKSIETEDCVVTGMPTKMIRSNIHWEM